MLLAGEWKTDNITIGKSGENKICDGLQVCYNLFLHGLMRSFHILCSVSNGYKINIVRVFNTLY